MMRRIEVGVAPERLGNHVSDDEVQACCDYVHRYLCSTYPNAEVVVHPEPKGPPDSPWDYSPGSLTVFCDDAGEEIGVRYMVWMMFTQYLEY